MDSDSETFDADPRAPCKYGDKCYQKNPAHHSKYKHPVKKRPRDDSTQGPSKRVKTDLKNSEDVDDNTVKPPKTNEAKMDDETNEAKMDDQTIQTNKARMEDETNEEKMDEDETKINDSNEMDRVGTDDSKVEIKLLPENFNQKEFIKSKFLVVMPNDFFKFWELCKVIDSKNPLSALKEVGLKLVGAFEVLAGKFDKTPEKSKQDYLLHWRFYYDPPEFQTVLIGNKQGYHIGYFRDSPSEMPVFLAENKSESNGCFSAVGDNIYAAVTLYLEDFLKSADPFKRMSIKRFVSLIKKDAEKHNFELARSTSNMKKREKAVVAKSFNKLGIVVPYDKKSELGYRELALSNRELKVLFEKLQKATGVEKDKLMVDLEPVLRYASIATDECDFGTGLELGLDILFYGIEWMNPIAKRYLCSAYKLLNKEEFAEIAEAHMNNRRKGTNLSII